MKSTQRRLLDMAIREQKASEVSSLRAMWALWDLTEPASESTLADPEKAAKRARELKWLACEAQRYAAEQHANARLMCDLAAYPLDEVAGSAADLCDAYARALKALSQLSGSMGAVDEFTRGYEATRQLEWAFREVSRRVSGDDEAEVRHG